LKNPFNNISFVFIIILAVGLVISLLTRPSTAINNYEDEINILKEQNKGLMLSNDSLTTVNGKLQKEINVILYTIDSTKVILIETEVKLAELEKRRNEIPNIISNMVSDDVTSNLSDYLKRRNKGGN